MSMRLKNIVVNGKRTSMRLEGFFWDSLDEICQIEHTTRDKLLSDLDLRITYNLTSAVRVFVAEYFRGAAADCSHERAGHGSGVPLILSRLIAMEAVDSLSTRPHRFTEAHEIVGTLCT